MKITVADRAWSLAVRDRDRWTCRKCLLVPAKGGLDAHHIFGRACGICTGHRTIGGKKVPGWKVEHYCKRLDVDMGISLCTGHHRAWAHAMPWEFHEWVRDIMGFKTYDELKARATAPAEVKVTA